MHHEHHTHSIADIPTVSSIERPNAIVYVNGFNLYYGLKDTGHKWLNIDEMCRRKVPEYRIVKVYYFTASVAYMRDPGPRMRQNFYWRALRAVPTTEMCEGKFRSQVPVRRKAIPPYDKIPVTEYKEKQTDVNIATKMLCDGFRSQMNAAIVISNDSDLVAPIKVLKNELGIPVMVLDPHGHTNSSELRQAGSDSRILDAHDFKHAQFPRELRDAVGMFHRPVEWD